MVIVSTCYLQNRIYQPLNDAFRMERKRTRFAAAVRMWAKRDRKGTEKKGMRLAL